VIAGTVVTRSSNPSIAAAALLDLNLAIELFRKTAPQSYRARVALVRVPLLLLICKILDKLL